MAFALATAGRASAQPETAFDAGKHAPLMSAIPKTKMSLFAAEKTDASLRKHEAQQDDDAKDAWPTDDFGRPLRGCDVPWDFVPLPRK